MTSTIEDPTPTAETSLVRGNRALRAHDYEEAIRHYVQCLLTTPSLGDAVATNMTIARKRYRASRQLQGKLRVAVCGWNLTEPSCTSHASALACLYRDFAEVDVVGPIFLACANSSEEPVRTSGVTTHPFVLDEDRRFLDQAIQLVATYPYDVVHLSRTHILNILFGILYKLLWSARVLVHIHASDLRSPHKQQVSVRDYLQRHGGLPDLQDFADDHWSLLAWAMVNEFDGRTFSSPAHQTDRHHRSPTDPHDQRLRLPLLRQDRAIPLHLDERLASQPTESQPAPPISHEANTSGNTTFNAHAVNVANLQRLLTQPALSLPQDTSDIGLFVRHLHHCPGMRFLLAQPCPTDLLAGTSPIHRLREADIRASAAEKLPITVLVVAWDVGHNPLGRAYMLADVLKRVVRHCVLVGFQFPRYGTAVWEPVRNASLPIIAIPGVNLPQFYDRLQAISHRIRPDVTIACKPRLPSVQLGMMLRERCNCPLVIDIDDHELTFFDTQNELHLSDLASMPSGGAAQHREPYSEFWTRLSQDLCRSADEIIVSNTALRRKFGGTVIPHVRDELAFDPGRFDKHEIRRRYGVSPAQKLLLFFGTPRMHKGLDTLAAAINALGGDFRLMVVGTPTDKRTIAQLDPNQAHAEREAQGELP